MIGQRIAIRIPVFISIYILRRRPRWASLLAFVSPASNMVVNSSDDSLRHILPPNFNHHVERNDENTFVIRAELKDEADATVWLRSFEQASKTHWIVKSKRAPSTGKHQHFVCHHSSFARYNSCTLQNHLIASTVYFMLCCLVCESTSLQNN